MSNMKDFVIENGILKDYLGEGGEVVIPEGITYIMSYAFTEKKDQLKSLIFPNSLKQIDFTAFSYCENLKEVVFQSNVFIGAYAFSNCKNLEKITFLECASLKRGMVFRECTGLKELYCPEEFAFGDLGEIIEDCYLLNGLKVDAYSEAKLQKRLIRNKDQVFNKILEWNNTEVLVRFLNLWKKLKLETLNEYIEKASQGNKTELTETLLEYKSKQYSQESQEKAVDDKLKKELGEKDFTLADWRKIFKVVLSGKTAVITGYKGENTKVEIPSKMGKHTVIAIEKAFCGSWKMEEVVLPDSIHRIGTEAFAQCIALTKLEIPTSVTEIGELAFESIGLTTIKLTANVTEIANNAFEDCEITIHAPAGSYAETYAKEHNIPFVAE